MRRTGQEGEQCASLGAAGRTIPALLLAVSVVAVGVKVALVVTHLGSSDVPLLPV